MRNRTRAPGAGGAYALAAAIRALQDRCEAAEVDVFTLDTLEDAAAGLDYVGESLRIIETRAMTVAGESAA